MFNQAVKTKIKAKIAISGPSGSGKTYSALRLATGLACGGKIALLDSERDRSLYYAKDFNFDHCPLDDHSPANYTKAINYAVENGYKVLVIDSMSHEWEYVLKEKEKFDTKGGSTFSNWAKFKKLHKDFLNKVLQSDIHIIGSYRAKTQYILDSKNRPKKAGMGLIGQDQDEYEYTIHFELTKDGHKADASKDNTGIFNGKFDALTESHGSRIADWCDEGTGFAAKREETVVELDSSECVEQIIQKLKELGNADAAKLALKTTFKVEASKDLVNLDVKLLNAGLRTL